MNLRFARDAETLYILIHIRNAGPRKYNLRLTVHYYDGNNVVHGSKAVPVEILENGDLKAKNSEVISTELSVDQLGDFEFAIRGKGWELEEDRDHRIFELSVLAKGQDKRSFHIDAVELHAISIRDEGDERPGGEYIIGTREPIPLNEEIGTYAIAKHMFYITPQYRLYDTKAKRSLTRTFPRKDDPYAWQSRLAPLYSPYFRLFRRSIGICPDDLHEIDDQITCYRNAEGKYQLMKGIMVPKGVSSGSQNPSNQGGGTGSRKQDDFRVIGVFAEGDIAITWKNGLGIMIALLAIALLGFLAYSENRHRQRALKISEQDNEAKAGFLGTFTHQAGDEFRDVKRRARELAEDEDRTSRADRLRRVENMLSRVWERLERAAHIFDYEDLVRKSITENRRQRPFDLANSLSELVDMFREDRGVEAIEFQSNLRAGDPRPVLSVTAPSDDDKRTPDGLFTEAMETILDNAVKYRQPEQSLITVMLDAELGHAVIGVSNYGPSLSGKMLREVFKLGLRGEGIPRRGVFAVLKEMFRTGSYRQGAVGTADGRSGARLGAASNSEPWEERSEESHRGLGLFLVRQIVRGYGGSCQLENFRNSYGSGIKVTVRLPVGFVYVANTHH